MIIHVILDGNDYSGISNLLLTFNSITTVIDIPVTINDDNVYELTEMFNATISFPGDPLPRVTLSPESALISIIDEDGQLQLSMMLVAITVINCLFVSL